MSGVDCATVNQKLNLRLHIKAHSGLDASELAPVTVAHTVSCRVNMTPCLDTTTALRMGKMWLPMHQSHIGPPGLQVPPALVGPHHHLLPGEPAKVGAQLNPGLLIKAPLVRALYRRPRNTCQAAQVVMRTRVPLIALIQPCWTQPSSTCLAPTTLNLQNRAVAARCRGPLTSQW